MNAGVAQLVEQLICNQQVGGSSPSTSSILKKLNMGEFPSGQRGQTVNLLLRASMVRIHLLPPECAGVAQLVEQLICNQQVGGSSPSTSSILKKLNMGEFPSGQRGQTVNLLLRASMVRIHLLPSEKTGFHQSFRFIRMMKG